MNLILDSLIVAHYNRTDLSLVHSCSYWNRTIAESTADMNQNDILWWGKNVIIGVCSLFFLMMGIDVLITAYSADNPHVFIMYFFSSNLMILISAVGIIFPVVKIYTRFRPGNKDDEIHEE